MSHESKTYRGRSLDELIPRIRAELGSEAIVVRSSEGLSGGIAGFFQKHYVEVEAREPLPHELPDAVLRNDRATAEGLSTPGMRALIEQAQPFSAQLAQAQVDWPGADPAPKPAPVSAGLYGPQPNLVAIASATSVEVTPDFKADAGFEADAAYGSAVAGDAGFQADTASGSAVAGDVAQPSAPDVSAVGAVPISDAPAAGIPAADGSAAVPAADLSAAVPALTPLAAGKVKPPPAAAAIETRLVAAGLKRELAADIVGEVVEHVLPFSGPRHLRRLVQTALAARIPVLSDIGPGARTLVFVGAGGAGKTAGAANLAVAYAAAGHRVLVVSLGEAGGDGDLAARLEPLGIAVESAPTAEVARQRIAAVEPQLAIIDTQAPRDADAMQSLGAAIRDVRPDEVHLALPATLSASAAAEVDARFRPAGVTHVALTQADATEHPGAPIGLAIELGRPLSYIFTRATAAPAEAAALAARLLP